MVRLRTRFSRKRDHEVRAAARLTEHLDVSAVCFDDAFGGGQSEPAAGGLGCEIWREDGVASVLRDAGAGVDDMDFPGAAFIRDGGPGAEVDLAQSAVVCCFFALVTLS